MDYFFKCTLWLCQNSYWKWPFIVDFVIKNDGSFHSYVAVYQRVQFTITAITLIFQATCPPVRYGQSTTLVDHFTGKAMAFHSLFYVYWLCNVKSPFPIYMYIIYVYIYMLYIYISHTYIYIWYIYMIYIYIWYIHIYDIYIYICIYIYIIHIIYIYMSISSSYQIGSPCSFDLSSIWTPLWRWFPQLCWWTPMNWSKNR